MKALLPTRRDTLRLVGVGAGLVSCAFLAVASCKKNEPIDEAKAGGLTTADFPQITADVFQADGWRDRAVAGRDHGPQCLESLDGRAISISGISVAQDSYGLMDLLKMLDNRKYKRGERFKTLGWSNQPGFHAPR